MHSDEAQCVGVVGISPQAHLEWRPAVYRAAFEGLNSAHTAVVRPLTQGSCTCMHSWLAKHSAWQASTLSGAACGGPCIQLYTMYAQPNDLVIVSLTQLAVCMPVMLHCVYAICICWASAAEEEQGVCRCRLVRT